MPRDSNILFWTRDELRQEVARLQAEVESLMTSPTSRLLRAEREENARLKAKVERLTKAGDELEKRYFEYATPDDAVKAWHAAKGVQS